MFFSCSVILMGESLALPSGFLASLFLAMIWGSCRTECATVCVRPYKEDRKLSYSSSVGVKQEARHTGHVTSDSNQLRKQWLNPQDTQIEAVESQTHSKSTLYISCLLMQQMSTGKLLSNNEWIPADYADWIEFISCLRRRKGSRTTPFRGATAERSN